MDLNDTVVFARVVRAGSFTRAAQELGMQKSSVSRKVADLEERLGTRLLQRTTRKLHLTDEGRLYFEHASRAVAELEEAEQALSGMRATPRGLLRVTAPLNFGFLASLLAEFIRRYPDVQLELFCTDRVVDLVEEGFDAAIRAGVLPDSTLIARKIAEMPRWLLASPAYLKKRGTPRTPQDLSRHVCLLFATRERPVWTLVASDGRREDLTLSSPLVTNDFEVLRETTIAGCGIALMPQMPNAEALRDGRLKRVLPEWASPPTPLSVVYPSTRHLSSKVKAFADVMQEQMRTK